MTPSRGLRSLRGCGGLSSLLLQREEISITCKRSRDRSGASGQLQGRSHTPLRPPSGTSSGYIGAYRFETNGEARGMRGGEGESSGVRLSFNQAWPFREAESLVQTGGRAHATSSIYCITSGTTKQEGTSTVPPVCQSSLEGNKRRAPPAMNGSFTAWAGHESVCMFCN